MDEERAKLRKTEKLAGLGGKKVVITGEPSQVSRATLESMIVDGGGQLMTGISGLTNILVYGELLEDGRPVTESGKYKKAKTLIELQKSKAGLRLMGVAEFLKEFELVPPAQVKVEEIPVEIARDDKQSWCDRYRPMVSSDFAANGDHYAALYVWLKTWTPSTPEKTAILLGPPGVGKTSAALALARNLGYTMLEFNASDTRSQKKLAELHSLLSGGALLHNGETQRHVFILMDEIDGLSAGDRGGAAELLKLAKITTIPLIFTANDQGSRKIAAIIKGSRKFVFQRCNSYDAVKRIKQICASERVAYNDAIVQSCYANSNGDMRYFVNNCQLILTMQDKNATPPIQKDLCNYDSLFTLFARMLNEWKSLDFTQKMNYFFLDYEMLPMFVMENIVATLADGRSRIDASKRAATMLDAAAYGDTIRSKARREGRWDLLPDYGFFSTILPLNQKGDRITRVDFPSMLGKMSSRNKTARLYNEVAHKFTSARPSCMVRSGILEFAGDYAFSGFLKNVDSGISHAMSFCETHGLDSRDLLIENIIGTRFAMATSPLDKLDSKAKTRLTREFSRFEIKQKTGKRAIKFMASDKSNLPNDDNESADEEDRMDLIF